MSRLHSRIRNLVALLALGGTAPLLAVGALLTVDSTADVVADDGTCTLREAVAAINALAPSGATPGECPAGEATINTVVFALPTGSTIYLTGGSLVLTRSATIAGLGADSLRLENALPFSRVFVFDGRINAVSVILQRLTVAAGEGTNAYDGLHAGYGGGVLGFELNGFSFDGVRFESNVATSGGGGVAIFGVNYDPLVQETEFVDNLVSGGTGGGGGGLLFAADATLQMRATLFEGNRALNSGAGPAADARGGGLWIPDGWTAGLNLEASTFSGNEAKGMGGALAFGRTGADADVTADIWDCTFTLNAADTDANSTDPAGGALYLTWNSGTTTLTNSVVAGNSDASTGGNSSPDLHGDATVLTSGGYNRIGIRRGANDVFDVGLPNANLDWVGSIAAPLAAGLGPLADNGGSTRSHLPQTGLAEPIVDQGSCRGVYDQRFWANELGTRIHDDTGIANADDGCDIGAIERDLGPATWILIDGFEWGDTREWSGVVGLAL